MTLSELLPTIQSLPRVDKLRMLQFLAADVARDEGVERNFAEQAIPIWSPYQAFEGAATLLSVLDDDKAAP